MRGAAQSASAGLQQAFKHTGSIVKIYDLFIDSFSFSKTAVDDRAEEEESLLTKLCRRSSC